MSREAVGPQFNEKLFDQARQKGWELLHTLSSQVTEGMTESELLNLSKKHSVEKWWHPTKIRFGMNTQRSFREPSEEGIKIKNGDLFFLDLGPVFEGHEADVGQTFRLGDPNFKNPAEEVFHELKILWVKDSLQGVALYEAACELAEKRGLLFNLKMGGHRLGDFPHALHHKGSLKDFEQVPQKERWILEVHLIERDHSMGYFFEDLL